MEEEDEEQKPAVLQMFINIIVHLKMLEFISALLKKGYSPSLLDYCVDSNLKNKSVASMFNGICVIAVKFDKRHFVDLCEKLCALCGLYFYHGGHKVKYNTEITKGKMIQVNLTGQYIQWIDAYIKMCPHSSLLEKPAWLHRAERVGLRLFLFFHLSTTAGCLFHIGSATVSNICTTTCRSIQGNTCMNLS